MDSFDLMSSEHFHVILHSDKQHALIFNRLDNSINTIKYDDAKELSNLKRIGRVYGIVGKYLNRYLVLIKNRLSVGTIYDPKTKREHQIFVISQVQVIDVSTSTISSNNNLTLEEGIQATKHSNNTVRYDVAYVKDDANSNINSTDQPKCPEQDTDFSSLPITISTSSYQSRANAWNPFKIANSIKTRMPTQLLKSAGLDTNTTSDGNPSEEAGSSGTSELADEAEKADKRLIDEMIKLFNNTNSFYFSPTLDLTTRFSQKNCSKSSDSSAIWKNADDRFFWNRHMLKDLIELSKNEEDANYFINVILQGFIAIQHHRVLPYNSTFPNGSGIESGMPATSMNSIKISDTNVDCDNQERAFSNDNKFYKLALVSRRSVYQAGTRYKRRGCDEEGNCANYVETEQIFQYKHHFTSFVILRGSIPLFWYQSGYNYRPPPVMFKDEEENHLAFTKHFKNLIESYESEQIIVVDCTEQTGREKALHDAFESHIVKLRNSYPNVKLIGFDFHKYCKGRRCSGVQVEKHLRFCGLNDKLLKDVKYYWNDGDLVLNQEGVFRVNCLDCSDRTNVVQRAIALQILDLQLARLGVIAPDTCPEDNACRKIMQMLWSTNGNVLSTQYCGTRALFTGDKKLAGYLKDTYSSASRYYFSKFRDAYRQAAIDAMLGVENDVNSLRPPENKDSNAYMDHYELMSLDPIYLGKTSGALLKDVGSRVSNRLARLKGRLNMKGFNMDSMVMSQVETSNGIEELESELHQDLACEALRGLNIDWPSSESIPENEKVIDSPTSKSVFSHLSNSDDNFQDDEFGQMMLSIDLSELQRLRNEDDKEGEGSEEKKQNCEEIDMTETCGLKTNLSESTDAPTTSTTST